MSCAGRDRPYGEGVRNPPVGLTEDALRSVLDRQWSVTTASLDYLPVGFGSHHWDVTEHDGTHSFVTVDELENKRHSLREPLDHAFDRLRASLTAARDLRDHGHPFVVAPIPTRTDEPLARMSDRLGVARYPFLDAESFTWGEFDSPEHRRGVLELLVAVHTNPGPARQHAMVDDFAIAHRDELEATIRSPGAVEDCGPYARRAALLIARNAVPVSRLLARYDELTRAGLAEPSRMVLTHGEPHPGNTMRAAGGWLLIDWDTALVAPPERDLWGLDPGDGSVLDAYAEATGVAVLASMLELYRIRWDLGDLAVDVSRFRRPHTGNLDDDTTWDIMNSLVARIA